MFAAIAFVGICKIPKPEKEKGQQMKYLYKETRKGGYTNRS
jgi:hypothetical protein